MTTFLEHEKLPADRYLPDSARTGPAPLVSRAHLERALPAVTTAPQPAAPAQARPAGPAGVLLFPGEAALPAARRLLVLVPDSEVNESTLAACLWELAEPRGLAVLLLGTLHRPAGQYRARRRLASIAAMTRDDRVSVGLLLAGEQDWRTVVRQVWRPGDVVVCPAELTARAGLSRRPLAPALLQSLAAPVYVVSGFYPAWSPAPGQGWAHVGAWLVPLLIIVVFFGLQAQLTQATAGGLQTSLLVLTVLVEFGLIAAWEKFQNSWS